ncbi:hypothetical protein U3516DRAFT_757588 [Neocallimastix sp. 'constans']
MYTWIIVGEDNRASSLSLKHIRILLKSLPYSFSAKINMKRLFLYVALNDGLLIINFLCHHERRSKWQNFYN